MTPTAVFESGRGGDPPRTRPRAWSVASGHMAAAALYLALAVLLTWPLAVRMDTHVPGTGADDNLLFLWNFWWMRQALADPARSFLETSHLFHPGGVDLVLHTHGGLPAFAGATLFGAAPLPVALNLTIVASCALNGFAVYLLAFRLSGHRLAAMTAGVFFAGSAPLAAHLSGHFNFYAAWVLVLFTHALLAAFDRASWPRVAAAGALLAAVAYSDYYYFVYACVFLGCVLLQCLLAPTLVVVPEWRRPSAFDAVLLAAAGTAAAAAGLIWWTGGFVVTWGSVRISATSGMNVRAAACALALWWVWRRRRPVPAVRIDRARIARDLRLAILVCALAALLMTPLLAAAAAAWRDGHYVSQTYLWRSAPAGADAGGLVLGNPFNRFWGGQVRRLYDALGMHAFDGPLWLGIVPLVLLVTRRAWRASGPSRVWLLVIAVFLVWSLGPYLLVFGIQTGLPLPQVLLRFVPIVANARIPGHAVVFVVLGSAVLFALAIASSRLGRSSGAVAGLLALVLADSWAAPVPLTRLDVPPLYARLASMPGGAVLELPLGIRDGFGEDGRFDPGVLYYQTVHGRPMMGGYVARLSPVVKARYHDSALLDALLRLSAGDAPDGGSLPDPAAMRRFLQESGVDHVVINDRMASGALQDYLGRLDLRLISDEEGRRLFAVE